MKLPIYMDYNATTPTDPRVVEAMMPFFTEHFGNAASRQHAFGWTSEAAVQNARKTIARSINAEANEIIFTSGATESNNLALKGIAEAYRNKGNHIITATTEHKSVIDVCLSLERSGFRVSYIPVDKYGIINLEQIRDAINENTILVSVMMANNEIGTLAPIAEIGKLCTERGILFHTDATQCVGKIPIDVQSMNIHLMSMSAHKLYGPKGIGALYVRGKNPRVKVAAQIDGGGHENGMRSGTLNVPAIVGLAKAVEIATQTMSDESRRIALLRDRLEHKLLTVNGARVNGDLARRLGNTINITFPNVPADDLMMALKKDVAISSGSACSSSEASAGKVSHVLRAIGINDEAGRCTVRISIGRSTTEEEIEYAGKKIAEAAERLQKISPRYLIENNSKQRTAPVTTH